MSPNDSPDAAASAAILQAIDANATNYMVAGVSFGPFKVLVAEASVFQPIWWNGFFLDDASKDAGPSQYPDRTAAAAAADGSGFITFFQYQGSVTEYLPLGDVISNTMDPSGPFGKPGVIASGGVMLFAPDQDPDALAHPTGFVAVCSDGGSGNPRNVVYYRMIAPEGYSPVGVCFSADTPDPSNYWCVRTRYLKTVQAVDVWSDSGQGWSNNGDLLSATFAVADPPQDGSMLLIPPTYLCAQDQANEGAFALIGTPSLLPVTPFAPPDPPSEPGTSGQTTTYGLGPVAIVPYTAIAADAGVANNAITWPFYFIASEPYWNCDASIPTPQGGDEAVTVTVGVSTTDSTTFQQSTSLTVDCNVGAQFDLLSLGASASFTQAFELITESSTTGSTEVQTQVQINFPDQPVTSIWSRHIQMAVYRIDGSLVDTINYSTNDQRFVPPGAAPTPPPERVLVEAST